MSNAEKYTPLAAAVMGYDWNVVQHFLAHSVPPELIREMWGSGINLYESMLGNTMSKEDLLIYFGYAHDKDSLEFYAAQIMAGILGYE